MNLTETKKTRELLVDGKLLRAYRDTVELPDGSESIREWIDHPGASAVVPLFADGSTLLVRQFRYPPQCTFLEVPAGKLDHPGEDPVDVARRELEEEVGYTAATLTRVASTYPCIGYSNEVIHLFLAEDLTVKTAKSDDNEFLEPVRMPLAEAVEQARQGAIYDAKSAVALLLVQAYLDRRADAP